MKPKYLLAAFAATTLLSACLETAEPSSGMIQEQVNESETSVEALNAAIPKYMSHVGSDYGSIGYAGFQINNEVAVGNLPVYQSGYDYYLWSATDTYMGPEWNIAFDMWSFYTSLIFRTNLVIKSVPDIDAATASARGCLGNALTYRAMAYFDMVRFYEYKHTGFADLDAKAQPAMKLTVPLVTEQTEETASRNNPRQPFYVMYRFIMNDLNRALTCLDGYKRTGYNKANSAVVLGMMARVWLELGSRFDRYPEDLTQQVQAEASADLAQYDKLGISTAADCYTKAAECARKAIGLCGAPLSKDEWYNTSLGFNMANHAWMLAVQISSDEVSSEWQNIPGFLAPEDDNGVAGLSIEGDKVQNLYGAQRMIDANLYSLIEHGDWRKQTWISPDDAGDADKATRYETLLKPAEWALMPAYTGFKFRPGSGNRTEYHTTAAVDYPLMRVEEMYLIEAEAIGHAQGVDAGKQALASFLNTYRFSDGTYNANVSTMKQFDNEILRQRRIEFWGEGIVGFDYKRLEHSILMDYVGTNHVDGRRFNFDDGYVAPRLNYCISSTLETDLNPAVVNNPDPSNVH